MEEQRDGEDATAVVQAKTRRVWTGPGCGRGGKGKWVDSVHTLKMELTEFPEELDVGCEDRGAKEDCKLCCLHSWKDGGAIDCDGDDCGVTRSERKMRSSALDIYT